MNTQTEQSKPSTAAVGFDSIVLLVGIPIVVWVFLNTFFVSLALVNDMAFLAVGAWAIWFVWTYKVHPEFLVRRFRKQL